MREHLSIPTAPGCGPSTLTKSGETFGLNLRFLLIVCVFVGNAIEPLIMRMPEMKAISFGFSRSTCLYSCSSRDILHAAI